MLNKNNFELRKEAKELMHRMTLDEKIGMIHGAELFRTAPVERLGIPALTMSDGPMGVRQEFEPANWKSVGNHDDYVTYLPCNSALAATWNRKLARLTGEVLGAEARGRGKDVILGPGVNIKRSPLCGRNFEYFSEDPFLTKEMAVPYIIGVQNWDVAACVKHFAVNNQETQRLWVDVKIDEKALREIYLPAFYDAVQKGNSYTVMGAYNKIYGEHCCQSEFLLNQILRKEWGYEGVVISDWGGVHDTEAAVNSGLDIEMSVTDNFDEYYMAEPLKKRIDKGEISEKVIDEKVIDILVLMKRLHMLDGERKSGTYNTPEHRQAALDVARESVVLLKNSKEKLPLSPEKTKELLVIGENADLMHALGGGSAEIKALYEITPLMGIKMLLGGNTKVTYVKGYCQDLKEENKDKNWQADSLENGGGEMESVNRADEALTRYRRLLREEAVMKAREFNQVIFIGGLNHEQDCEGNDRADMKLPYEQDLLIEELLEANPDTVIVMVGGSPVEMGRWIDRASSVIWSWYAGMEGGRALAEVLFGRTNPSGKLPESFYKTHMDCSAYAWGNFGEKETADYAEGVFVGYRYLEAYHVEPEFCFGHGLSYTSFVYESAELIKENGKAYVECQITNIGKMDGKETIQIYLGPKERTVDLPVRQLKGFEKVFLKSGEKKKLRIEIEGYSENMDVWAGSSLNELKMCAEKKGEP
ncbi:MAG: glycoside hydrolase family 3 C-terminal domain-containing protein [Lachnospiraceae bacterium]|nr:glycoside hydrolase family 3 C-terminal domain-containing protein [Lachnospiraceae bacterium]